MIRIPSLNVALDFRHTRDEVQGTSCVIWDTHAVSDATGGDGFRALGSGLATCHRLDNFNKETGRKIALKYALKAAGFNENERRLVWEGYFNRPRTSGKKDEAVG